MNKLIGNNYIVGNEQRNSLGGQAMKSLPFQTESLYGMAMYDFDTLNSDIQATTTSSVLSPSPLRAVQGPPPVFHPVDEYKDLSLKEILDLSDDFLSQEDDTLLGSTELASGLEPVPFANGSSAAHLSQASVSLSQQAAELGINLDQPPLRSTTLNPKKRSRSTEAKPTETTSGSRERRFRPYQAGQWAEKFEELCDYKQKMGHCLVPHTYNENLALARWVKRQRYQYKLMMDGKSSTMTAERVKALEEIGFVWDSQGAAWGDRLGELEEFRKTYMHCNVPSNFSDNPRLATWIKCQRRQYKLYMEGKPSNMTPQRIQHLESLGFEWELRTYKKQRTN